MTNPEFRLCTYRCQGFTSVGLGVGREPEQIIDVQRAFTFMHRERGQRQFLLWPTQLDMRQVLTNWDYFNARFADLARLSIEGQLPDAASSDFVYPVADITFAAPISNPGKTLNAGGNYYDHMEEMGVVNRDAVNTQEDIPYIFVSTPDNTLIGDGDTIVLPKQQHWRRPETDFVTWEVEIAAVMGRTAKDVSREEALDFVAGYTIFQDVSAEAVRTRGAFEMDWYTSKSGNTFAPTGPWIVPTEFVPDPQNLRMRTIVNGDVKQDSSTSQMMWSIAEMVSYASSISQLEPGDILTTGTCAGSGSAKGMHKLDREKALAEAPPGIHYGSALLLANKKAGNNEYLSDGDVMVSEIECLGRLTNRVVAEK